MLHVSDPPRHLGGYGIGCQQAEKLAVETGHLYRQNMTVKEFRNVFEAQPFRRFTIRLADGRQVPVEHQEFAMLSPSGRTLIVYQEDDSFQVIDLMLATGVEVNGRRGKKTQRRPD